MKTSSDAINTVIVGGGAFVMPNNIKGINLIDIPKHSEVANAIGSAFAQVSGYSEKVFATGNMTREEILLSSKNEAIKNALSKGADKNTIEIIDVEGKQVGDLMAWVRDTKNEWFSPAHSVTQNWKIRLDVDDLLVTNLRREIFKIIYDDVGYHDIIVPCCDEQAYIRRYGLEGHRSCLENIREALLKIGERQHLSGELAWNMFMKNKIQEDGEVIYEEPIHPPGSKIILEAVSYTHLTLPTTPYV